MRRAALFLILITLAGCEGGSTASQDLVEVHNAADAMERSQSFVAGIIVDMEMPDRFTTDVKSTIAGRVDLTKRESTFEARSDDGDRWSEIVVADTVYNSGGEIANAPDWCAVPVAKIDDNALIHTGSLFGEVPDLLRSASDASTLPEASTATATAYRVSFPLDETVTGARVEGDEATIWLDEEGRPVRAEFAFSQLVSGSTDPAIGHVEWVLSDWGAEVEVTPPPTDEIESFPDCLL